MSKFIQVQLAILVAAVTTLVVLLCLVARDIDRRVVHFDQTITDTNRTIAIVAGAATDLQKTLALERTAATDQITATNTLLSNGSKTLTGMNETISRFGETITLANETISTLNGAIGHQDETLTSIEKQAAVNLQDLDASEKQMGPALDHFNVASATLAAELPGILTNINQTTAQTVAIGKNVAGTTQELEMTAHDVRTFADRQLAPVRGTWNIVKGFLVSFAGPAAQVATAAK